MRRFNLMIKMKTTLGGVGLIFFWVLWVTGIAGIEPANAGTFSCADPQYASSPVCKGEHPRLHITKANLADFQARMAGDYKAVFQSNVTWAENNFGIITTGTDGMKVDIFAFIYARERRIFR